MKHPLKLFPMKQTFENFAYETLRILHMKHFRNMTFETPWEFSIWNIQWNFCLWNRPPENFTYRTLQEFCIWNTEKFAFETTLKHLSILLTKHPLKLLTMKQPLRILCTEHLKNFANETLRNLPLKQLRNTFENLAYKTSTENFAYETALWESCMHKTWRI